MEQQRLLLFVALAFIVFLIFEAWQKDHMPLDVPRPATSVPQTTQPANSSGSVGVPTGESGTAVVPAQSSGVGQLPADAITSIFRHGQQVRVKTDVFDIVIDSIGGDIRQLELPKFPVDIEHPDKPFQLMEEVPPNIFVAQSGFTTKRATGDKSLVAAPNHITPYQVSKTEYQLKDGKNELKVDLTWKSPEGVIFTKTYIFRRGSYLINVTNTVNNPTRQDWRGNLYYQLRRTQGKKTKATRFVHTYMGGVIYSPEEKYEKIKFSEIKDSNLKRDITGGWAAMTQHYFLGAWIPETNEAETFYTHYNDNNVIYTIGFKDKDESHVAAGSQRVFKSRLYAGPKDQPRLEKIAPGLELTVDYGVLTILAKPIFWLMRTIHSFVGNWGWSIILLTILIKAAFYKLSETSYKSMAKMRAVQPRMVALKERYSDDRQAMNRALMDLYKKEKINPLGGCFPILVQIPVFIALYWVLLESVELRQAPWILWIKDMSIGDPYFILPLIMGVSMFIQQRLNPAPLDPIQAKVMMVLPVVFTVFFMFFPSGLVLYWVVNNMLSISQQWYITRRVIKA